MKKTISIFLLMCFSLSLMGMASAETGSNEVTTGTLLGYMGTTGNSTGVHLHFGIQARNTAYTSSDGYTTSGFFGPEIILK